MNVRVKITAATAAAAFLVARVDARVALAIDRCCWHVVIPSHTAHVERANIAYTPFCTPAKHGRDTPTHAKRHNAFRSECSVKEYALAAFVGSSFVTVCIRRVRVAVLWLLFACDGCVLERHAFSAAAAAAAHSCAAFYQYVNIATNVARRC